MNILETIILGLVQGLTEFIPVSSSGHLVIFEHLFTGSADHLFIEFINFGTLAAVIIFFRAKIKQLTVEALKNKQYRLLLNLLITSLPAGLLGFALADFINANTFFTSVLTVIIALFLGGVMLVLIDKLPIRSKIHDIDSVKPKDALYIGLFQVLALVPGVSRSGSTIVGSRLLGLNNKNAAEYSFLASIPLMLGVCLKLLIKDTSYLTDNLSIIIISNLVAFLAGMFAIRFMLDYLSKKSLAIFGWYRITLSVLILITLLAY